MLYIDTTSLNNPCSGIGKTVNQLIKSLKRNKISLNLVNPPTLNGVKSLIYYNLKIPLKCKRELSDADIFLIPNNLGKYLRLPHKRTWVIVHDLIPLSRFGYRGIKRFLYLFKMRQIRKAERILTISETVKKQIVDVFKLPSEKIDVIYWPVTENNHIPESVCPQIKFSYPYFLSIGTGEPRKNIEPIIGNWCKISSKGFNLVLFGREWKIGVHDKLLKLIIEHNLGGRIFLVGKVSEEELYFLYKHATGMIFPSLEEGFGLPPLEALSVGTPVILPKTPINFELYSEVAHFYSIGNIHELHNAIEEVIVRKENPNALRDFCKRYSEAKFEQKLFEIFNEENIN